MVSTDTRQKRLNNNLDLNRHIRYYLYAIIVIVFITICISISPFTHQAEGDSGAFLYIGEQILHHRLPYRDIFDQKGPVIFYINALGLLIGHGSVWGVWVLEILFLATATYVGFRLLYINFDLPVAYFVSVLWLISLTAVLGWGNLVEEYAIPLQLFSLFIFNQCYRGAFLWRSILIGIIAGILFFLRPNLIGLPLAIFLYCAYRLLFLHENKWMAVKIMMGMVVGSVVTAAITIGYFGYNHSLSYFWECAFTYNLSYSHSSIIDKIGALFYGLEQLPVISFMSILSWCLVVYLKIVKRLPFTVDSPIVTVCLLILPIEFILSSTSGRNYGHYFMAWLPSMTVLSGVFAYIIFVSLRHLYMHYKIKFGFRWTAIYAISILTFLPLSPISGKLLTSMLILVRNVLSNKFTIPIGSVAQYIKSNSTNDDTVLILGNTSSGINYLSHRRSPTRFAYQLPLYDKAIRPGYIKEFIAEVKNNNPALIVQSHEVIDPSSDFWAIPGMDNFQSFIKTNYHLIKVINQDNMEWRVLQRNLY